jgi:hypothetical protein
VIKAPGGFALASRIERYDPATGMSAADDTRWNTQPTFVAFDRSLFVKFWAGEEAHFRLFLFVVTDQPLRALPQPKLSREGVVKWVYARSDMLPHSVEDEDVAGKYCVVFIYTFGGKQRDFPATEPLPAETQLRNAGLMKGLETYASRQEAARR